MGTSSVSVSPTSAPPNTSSLLPGRFITIVWAGSATIPSFSPCWLQVVPPGDSWDMSSIHLMAPSTSQTRWQTQHQQPEPWLGCLGTSLGLGSSRKENLPAPKPPPGCRSPVLPVRDGKQSISPGLDKLRAVGRSILGGWGGHGVPCSHWDGPTWWWGISSCARSARRRRRRRSRTGGCACRERGDVGNGQLGLYN